MEHTCDRHVNDIPVFDGSVPSDFEVWVILLERIAEITQDIGLYYAQMSSPLMDVL